MERRIGALAKIGNSTCIRLLLLRWRWRYNRIENSGVADIGGNIVVRNRCNIRNVGDGVVLNVHIGRGFEVG